MLSPATERLLPGREEAHSPRPGVVADLGSGEDRAVSFNALETVNTTLFVMDYHQGTGRDITLDHM